MACARDGQRRPALAESADLIASGLRMRLRVPLPARTVRYAVGLMYAGAALSIASLINAVYVSSVLVSIDDNKIHHMTLPEVTGMIQVPPVDPAAVIRGAAGYLGVIALWLGLARAASHRRRWARMAATALAGLATLQVGLLLAAPGLFLLTGIPGDPLLTLVTWPVGAAAVWLLWRPASTTFLTPRDSAAARPGTAGR